MRKNSKKYSLVAMMMAASILMSSCGAANKAVCTKTNSSSNGTVATADEAVTTFGDGEIKGSSSISEFFRDLDGDVVYKEGIDEAVGYSDKEVYETDDYSTVDEIGDDYIDGDYYYNDAEAGTLTGGELRDLLNWDNYLRSVDQEILAKWDVVSTSRVTVHLYNGDTPIMGTKVVLTNGQSDLFTAVTDVTGNAYLFYNLVNEDVAPTGIKVYGDDGSVSEYALSDVANSKNEVELEVKNTNKEVNVDLMFVVDTTGSMWDELDYLKAEIQDVIDRASDETGMSIRTSVNFYRDQEDEYLVRYFDFRDDAAEVKELVGEQTADGGGDYPEAVYEAFDNALNEHNWNENSIKLMFVVLDAPPHEEDATELAALVKQAAEMGVRIIPIMSSGADAETEYLFRSYAAITGGTYLFLDDNSGVGYAHETPANDTEYDSEYLNEMMIRVIGEYCGKDLGTEVVEITPAPVQGN